MIYSSNYHSVAYPVPEPLTKEGKEPRKNRSF